MKLLKIGLIIFLAFAVPTSSALDETATPIKHVIVIMQENHSFDNYFGTYPTANGTLVNDITAKLQRVNGIPRRICLPYRTGCLSPYYANDNRTDNPIEGQDTYENDFNNGKMDGFATYSGSQSMAYFDYHQIAAYWIYAEEYGLADDYFASALTTTTPNRLLLLAGDTLVSHNYGPPPYVPYDQTILNQLSAKGISWGYFDFLTPFGERSKVYPINYLSGLDSNSLSRVQDLSSFFQYLSKGSDLPSVSFVNTIGLDKLDEHPPFDVTAGQLWVVSVVNAVMESDYWNSSAILITYDEGGGYYDHVAPPQLLNIDHGFAHVLHGYGHRVPLLVISPYVKENYVSETLLNHMSLLRFIDYNWHLPSLNQNVANSNNLLDFFYFGVPRAPIILEEKGAYSVRSYPAPLQIPLNKLPYARRGSWTGEENQLTLLAPIYLIIIPILAASVILTLVALWWRAKRFSRKLV